MRLHDYLAPLRGLRLHAGLEGATLGLQVENMDLALIAEAAPRPGERALDLGCGAGLLVRDLRARGIAATGIDRDAALHPPIVGDARALPLSDASLDIVFAQEVLSWIDGLDAALAEIVRVLRPGGRLAIGDYRFDAPTLGALWSAVTPLSGPGFRAALEGHGLAVVAETDVTAPVTRHLYELYQALPEEPVEMFALWRPRLGHRVRALKALEVRRLIMIARKP